MGVLLSSAQIILSLSSSVMASSSQQASDRTIPLISILSNTPDIEVQSTTSLSFKSFHPITPSRTILALSDTLDSKLQSITSSPLSPLHPSAPSRALPPHIGGAFQPPFPSFCNRLFHFPLHIPYTVPSPPSLVILSLGDSSEASMSSIPSL